MDLTFECDCADTGYEGATCERGIVTVPTIPTLSQNVEYRFNITARPATDILLNIDDGFLLSVSPNSITLSRSAPTAEVSVTGSQLGQYTLRYSLTGPIADSFNTPENSLIFVGPEQRRPEEVNAYFQSVKSEIGYLNESCCMSSFVYPECPMTTDTVTFLSTCSWTSDDNIYVTDGIVFARFKTLSVPVSISGITIDYNNVMGSISASVPEASYCRSCEANRNKLVRPNQSKVPEGFENCYYYPVQPGDIADFLSSYALATTFIHRVSLLLPSWFEVQLVQPASAANPSFNDGDFSTSLVEQEGVSGIEYCEKVRPDYPGLYSVLTYSGSLPIQVRINEENQTHELKDQTACLAVNLCREMASPVYLQLPQSIQDRLQKLTLFKPYLEADWSFSLDTVTFYPLKKSTEISGMYWNGTDMYSPQFPGADLEIGSFVYPSFTSFKEEHVRVKADPFGELGEILLNIESAQVSNLLLTSRCLYF